jgi:hypothetical protein
VEAHEDQSKLAKAAARVEAAAAESAALDWDHHAALKEKKKPEAPDALRSAEIRDSATD